MQIIPKANTLRKGVLLYRGIRYRKGFGVHSPFVFNLITKVIEERCQYYSFYDIELIRKQLLFQNGEIAYPDRQQKGKMRSRTIGQIVEREAIRPKHGALAFPSCQLFQIETYPSVGSFHGPVHFVPDFIRIRTEMYRPGKRAGVCLHRPYRFQ